MTTNSVSGPLSISRRPFALFPGSARASRAGCGAPPQRTFSGAVGRPFCFTFLFAFFAFVLFPGSARASRAGCGAPPQRTFSGAIGRPFCFTFLFAFFAFALFPGSARASRAGCGASPQRTFSGAVGRPFCFTFLFAFFAFALFPGSARASRAGCGAPPQRTFSGAVGRPFCFTFLFAFFALFAFAHLSLGQSNVFDSPRQPAVNQPATAPAAAPAAVAPGSSDSISAPAGYQLSANDQVAVEVFGEDDLRTNGRLNGEGNLSLPLLGSVHLGGLTLTQAVARLTELYGRDYLVNPKINVTLVGYARRRFTVLGQVNRPGSYEMPEGNPGGIDLLEAIAMAGGYTRIAAPDRISVRRHRDGRQRPDVESERQARGQGRGRQFYRRAGRYGDGWGKHLLVLIIVRFRSPADGSVPAWISLSHSFKMLNL